MKKRHVIIGALLTVMMMICGAMAAFASGCEGHLDSVNGNTINGWGWNSEEPDSAADVRVVVKQYGSVDAVLDTTVTASLSHDGLKDVGKGTGSYGFTATIDWSALESGLYTVECTVNGEFKTNTLYYQNGQDAAVSGGSLIPLGVFKTTAYCPCRSCSSGWGGRTSTGTIAKVNHTISVDPSVIPYGSRILIGGIIYTAEDCGGGVNGRHIDIYLSTHAECRNYGVRNVEAYLVP